MFGGLRFVGESVAVGKVDQATAIATDKSNNTITAATLLHD